MSGSTVQCETLYQSVELFPVVGLATGTILGAADVRRVGPHSIPRSTNIFVETLSGGVSTGPDG